MASIKDYIMLLQTVQTVADKLVDLIKDFAIADLSPEELAALEAAWQEDVDRTKRNAGL
jgi:hypothetical protein